MKNLRFFFLFLFFTGFLQAQEIDCLTAPAEGTLLEEAQSGDLTGLQRVAVTDPIRIIIHVIRRDDGSGGATPTQINSKLDELYDAFDPVYFQFFVYETKYLDNSTYFNIDDIFEADLLRNEYYIYGCINIYFVNSLYVDGSNLNGMASFSPRTNPEGPQGIIIRNDAHITTLPHEMGHFFDLYHTFETYFGFENIDRNGGCANWDTRGDLLYDTHADPWGRMNVSGINHLNCQWDPVKTPPKDGCDQTNYTPLTTNYMITEVPSCRNSFTPNQGSRMNQTLLVYRPELLQHLIHLQNTNGETGGYLTGTLNFGPQSYYSGNYITAPNGQYSIGTNNERFINQPGLKPTIKHKKWNEESYDHLMYRTVLVNQNLLQHAKFFGLDYVKIESKIEGAVLSNIGTFEFQDPWYVLQNGTQPGDHWIQATSEYEPNGKYGANEKGVFLNQDFNQINNPFYSLKNTMPGSINLSQTGKSHSVYFLGWSASPGNGADFQYQHSSTTGVVFKSAGTIVQSNIKLSEVTSNSSAYANSGQRHIVREYFTGENFNVYESMGYIWLEKSTDNGATWSLANGAAPVSSGIAKSPAMEFCNGNLLIVYQEKTSSDNLRIKIKLYSTNSSSVVDSAVVWENEYVNYSFDSQPVLADFAGSGKFVVVYRNDMESDPFNPSGLYYDAGTVAYNSQAGSYYISGLNGGIDSYISGTDENSSNPAISTMPSGSPNNIHLLWQQGNLSDQYCHIMYQKIVWNGSTFSFPAQENISYGKGYTWNYKPSITSITSDDIPRVTWIGYIDDSEQEFEKQGNTNGTTGVQSFRETVFRALDNPSAWSFGSNVVHANINRLEGTPGYAIAWSQQNGSSFLNKCMKNTNFYTEYSLSTSGSAVELNNGGLFTTMFGYALHTGTTPYYFNKSQYLSAVQKEQLNSMSASRAGVLFADNAQFIFSFGDITADNNPVLFPVIPDTLNIQNFEHLKQFMVSDPFMLQNQSEFGYSVQYRVLDTAGCSAVLGETGIVNFRLVLEDYVTGEILGEYDNVNFTRNALTKYDNISYQVNTSGIGTRQVRLRLIPSSSVPMNSSLLTRVRSANEVSKGNVKQVYFNGSSIVTDYSLSQNYPNPFNPVTQIEFALPEKSEISVKVYDILGNELAVLASGLYEPGRYTVPFDGGSYASGVYICKLSYGRGQTITKKMTLLK